MTEATEAPVEGQASQATDTPPPASWTETLPDDLRGYVETKGFKDPAAVLSSYQNLEKLRGVPEDRLLKLPEKMDADGLAPIYDKLGRPEAPDKYTRALPEGFDDGVFKAAAETAHKLGLNDAQFSGLQKVMQDQAVAVEQAREEQSAKAFDAWKSKNAEGFNNAARVMATLGMDEAGLEGLLAGDKVALYDFLAKVGGRSAEGQIVHGEKPEGEFGLSPAAAKAKVSELMADAEFMKAYTSTNSKVREPAIERISKLHEIAARARA
jgi:hypothetical protein